MRCLGALLSLRMPCLRRLCLLVVRLALMRARALERPTAGFDGLLHGRSLAARRRRVRDPVTSGQLSDRRLM